MANQYVFDLSPKAINKAIRALAPYTNDLQKNVDELRMEMANDGYAELQAFESAHTYTGATVATSKVEHSDNTSTIVGGVNLVWLEFGTGVNKNGSVGSYPHPKAEELGMSAIGTYGKGKGANQKGWWYRGDDGQRHHTLGHRAYMPMYNIFKRLSSREYLQSAIDRIFR